MDTGKYLLSPIVLLLISSSLHFTTAKYVIRLRDDTQCPMAGYFRDETDCRKFYRCAEHPTGVSGQNFISRSEFNCPPGTIFDEVLSGCNHIMFVHNIQPGCDVSGGIPGSSSPGSHNNSGGNPPSVNTPVTSSTTAPSITPTTLTPPLGIQLGQPPQLPENMQMIPTFPGSGDNQQQNQPILPPAIKLPMMPGGGDQQQQQPPMFPSINFPMMPGGDQNQQPPMFPSINFPMMPGGDQGQQPMFPPINFPQQPGNHGQQPMIPVPSNPPSVPDGGQQHQFLMPFMPHFNLPSISGSPQLPQLTLPSNFNQNQNNPYEQNLQHLAGSSMQPPSTSITITAQNSENKPSSQPGWETAQQFPEQTVVKPHDISSSGWVVPSNFPTFYSAFARSPVLLSTSMYNHPAF